MPLVSIESVSPDARLGLWSVTETMEELFDRYPFPAHEKEFIRTSYKSVRRRMEALVVRLLLRQMLGEDAVLYHHADGRPFLSGGLHVSISHTRGCVAAIVSACDKVSVDVECLSERVCCVKDRFMRKDEKAGDLPGLLLHWCAKETLYKLYPEDRLRLKEMRVLSVSGNDTAGIIVAENIPRGETVNISYCISGGFVLTYTGR